MSWFIVGIEVFVCRTHHGQGPGRGGADFTYGGPSVKDAEAGSAPKERRNLGPGRPRVIASIAVESPLFRCLALCAEFPNDNPLLYGREPPREPIVEAEPVPQPAIDAAPEPVAETGTDPAPPVLEADHETDDIDLDAHAHADADEDDDLDAGEIEIVDDLVIEGAVEEAPSLPPPPSPADDPFDALVAVLEDVARCAGASEGALHTLRVLVGRERIGDDALATEHSSMRAAAAAWGAILRGESEDFSTCGACTLDEWSSTLIAAALGQPARADSLRRELRRRGVAAFGLLIEAA